MVEKLARSRGAVRAQARVAVGQEEAVLLGEVVVHAAEQGEAAA